MMYVSEIKVCGIGIDDASIKFSAGANILAGVSDTGKSYLLHCLDYIFGADEMVKRPPEAEPYSKLFVEFRNSEGKWLTLERDLSGGDLAAHNCPIAKIEGQGAKVAARRSGKSMADDVTSVLLPFASMNGEAKLRKDANGSLQRLTVRTLSPIFLVNEVSIIAERSLVVGEKSFDETARKRMLSYLLSGKDDHGIIVTEKKAILKARNTAQLSLIESLLEPLEERSKSDEFVESAQSIERVEDAIYAMSSQLTQFSEAKLNTLEELRLETTILQKADSQIIAIDEVLSRYQLLNGRYESDLSRLDFVAEGSHYFESLVDVTCPLCDQPMSPDHAHKAEENSKAIYEGAKAEASKILALKADLQGAIQSLENRRLLRLKESNRAKIEIKKHQENLSQNINPTIEDTNNRLENLLARRVELEVIKNDKDQIDTLRAIKSNIEEEAKLQKGAARKWEPLPSKALRELCKEVETVLHDWKWKGEANVEFNQDTFDITVDGQARISHGKGVRAILYSAFVVGLLRYCQSKSLPHPGFVVLDSPLTSYKKGKKGAGTDGPIDADIEKGFWESLTKLSSKMQIIVIENKEPPSDVAGKVHYEWFAGEDAEPGERVGFLAKQ